MRTFGIAALCALVAGFVVCMIAWPNEPPVREGNGPFLGFPPEVVAMYAGTFAAIVGGSGALIVMGIRRMLRPRAPQPAVAYVERMPMGEPMPPAGGVELLRGGAIAVGWASVAAALVAVAHSVELAGLASGVAFLAVMFRTMARVLNPRTKLPVARVRR